jgi:uncharacterized protein YutE (UPF0331/DUF86 family)
MNERIKDKIEQIEKFLQELSEMVPKSLEEYKKDFIRKAACERYVEKIIEAMLDLTFLIIRFKSFKNPEDEENSLAILYENKIISKDLSENLRKAKGMRNVIVHEYGMIDDEKIFHAVYKELEKDMKEFIKSIELSLR